MLSNIDKFEQDPSYCNKSSITCEFEQIDRLFFALYSRRRSHFPYDQVYLGLTKGALFSGVDSTFFESCSGHRLGFLTKVLALPPVPGDTATLGLLPPVKLRIDLSVVSSLDFSPFGYPFIVNKPTPYECGWYNFYKFGEITPDDLITYRKYVDSMVASRFYLNDLLGAQFCYKVIFNSPFDILTHRKAIMSTRILHMMYDVYEPRYELVNAKDLQWSDGTPFTGVVLDYHAVPPPDVY